MSMLDSRRRTVAKTLTDKLMEIGLSSLILYLFKFPLELAIGIPIIVEILQVVVYILNERIWSKSTWETSHEYHLCEPDKCPLPKCLCPYHSTKVKENGGVTNGSRRTVLSKLRRIHSN